MSETIIQLNEWRCRDAPCEKYIVETRSSLSNIIKDTSTIMRNPCLHIFRQRITHDYASVSDNIANGTSCFHYIFFAWCILTLPLIQLNDFYACFTHFLVE